MENGRTAWSHVAFEHPATFDTLAMDPDLKREIMDDLLAFSKGKDFYAKAGKPWKRGYLLYGPPGTGKSSMIAAMANFLRYDVYDLELTRVASNAALRSLLLHTTNRSLIVIEDIDCSLHLTADRRAGRQAKKQKKKTEVNGPLDQSESDGDASDADGRRAGDDGRVTLSGLLNFTDGLWSCCGDERIIVFTTNYADRVDPALLRPGRMDVHVRLGPCGAHAARELAERYVGVAEHELLGEVESCIEAGAEMTPAEVGEVLLRSREQPDTAVRELVAELRERLRGGGGRGDKDVEGWEEAEGSPEKKETRWEGRVRFLGRLRSLTKSDSGRRGV